MDLEKLIDEVWRDPRSREIKMKKGDIRILMTVIIDQISAGLLQYGKVKLQNLFTLEIRKAKGRKIANPITRKHMYIDDYHKIKIEPSKRLKQGLKDYEK